MLVFCLLAGPLLLVAVVAFSVVTVLDWALRKAWAFVRKDGGT